MGNRQARRRDGDEARAEVVEVVLAGLELPAQFARGQRWVISRQAGIEDRGGHKQALVCFPSPLLYAPARRHKPRIGPGSSEFQNKAGVRMKRSLRFIGAER